MPLQRPCGRTSAREGGRTSAAGTSSSSSLKYTVPAAAGGGVVRPVASFISISSTLALAGLCPRGARRLSQGHRDGHPFVAKPRPEPSLPPTHGGSRSSVVSHGQPLKSLTTVYHQNEQPGSSLVLVFLVFLVLTRAFTQCPCRQSEFLHTVHYARIQGASACALTPALVAQHPGVQLPASAPPPRPSTTHSKNCVPSRASKNHPKKSKNDAKCVTFPPSPFSTPHPPLPASLPRSSSVSSMLRPIMSIRWCRPQTALARPS